MPIEFSKTTQENPRTIDNLFEDFRTAAVALEREADATVEDDSVLSPAEALQKYAEKRQEMVDLQKSLLTEIETLKRVDKEQIDDFSSSFSGTANAALNKYQAALCSRGGKEVYKALKA